MTKCRVDDLICRLLNVGAPLSDLTKQVPFQDIINLCSDARASFLSQPPLVEVEPPIKLCGDTHGQYGDVLRLFNRGGFPPVSNYLFLGDYVDRGHQSLETILLLMAYKVRYPNNFFLLRGNHECQAINQCYGFFEECNRRYREKRGHAIYLQFQTTFATMPYVGLVAGKIICMHGGLSPRLKSLEQLKCIPRNIENPANPSLLLDLLWADPDIGANGWEESTRGVSYVFGPDVVHEACKQLGIDLVARAHQVVQDGYEFFANRKLVTIFSAPHYCGSFDNAAAMMHVDEQLICTFHVLKPDAKVTQAVVQEACSNKSDKKK